MIEIHKNYSLKNKNTFNVAVCADYFVAPQTKTEIQELISDAKYKNIPKLVLGSGSNMLFTKNYKGLIIHPQIKGITIENETKNQVIVKVGAGEIWDDLVNWAVQHDLGGLENLSLIPGRVGASPVQNIGAYGVELKDVVEKVLAVEIKTGKLHEFSKQECNFAYRNSIFKNEFKNQYIITEVYFKLTKKHQFNLAYGNIQEELKNFDNVNLQTIRQAIINIREAKLPNPDKIPNAGSFFKNPVVSEKKYQELIQQFPQIVAYKLGDNSVKLAAGWLIDQSGLKGTVLGQAGVHKNQALVLVNNGNASGSEILKLAEHVKETVFNKFTAQLDFEVNIY